MFPLRSIRRSLYISLAVLFLVAPLVGCSPKTSTTIRMPSGAYAPAQTDPAFVSKVDSLVRNGEEKRELAVVVRFEDAYWGQRLPGDLEPLHELSGGAWILVGSASAIQEFVTGPEVRSISEYKPEYKYNHTLAGASVVWVYIEVFAGYPDEVFAVMDDMGIYGARYIDIPGYYYGKATGEQVVELAELWWVKNIYRAHRRFDLH
jgi:hypothetical protein